MRIASNKISDISRFFRTELEGLFPPEEIRKFVEFCLEAFSGIRGQRLATDPETAVPESELLKYSFAVKELKRHRPIQYILGTADFYGLKFRVNDSVLIPRPETEELADLIIREYKGKKISVLDIGTGSGCIAITLKKFLPEAEVTAMDISEEALSIAAENAGANDVSLGFIRGDVLDPSALQLLPQFDLVVSNPPYISHAEKNEMERNVLAHEPHLALFVKGNDPLLFYKVIAGNARLFLKPGGVLFFEINPSFDLQTKSILEDSGFKNVMLIKDLSNKNRILRGTFH